MTKERSVSSSHLNAVHPQQGAVQQSTKAEAWKESKEESILEFFQWTLGRQWLGNGLSDGTE